MLVHLANVHILPDRVYHGCNSVAIRDNLLSEASTYSHTIYSTSPPQTKPRA